MRTNWEWEQFGEDIRRTVQDAVDSRDFRRLNQTITDTVNSAFHEFTDGMRNPRGGYQYQKADYGTGRQKDRTKGAWQNLDLNQLKRPTLYAGTRAKKAAGLTMTITGYTIAGCLLIGGLITGVTGMLLGAGVGVSVALSIQVILLAVFTALGITGTKLFKQGEAVSDLYRRATGQRIWKCERSGAEGTEKRKICSKRSGNYDQKKDGFFRGIWMSRKRV